MSRHATSRLLTLLTSQPSRQSSSLILRASFTTVHRSSQSPSPASSASTSASATKPPVPPPQEAHKNTAQVARDLSRASDSQPVRDLTDGLSDPLPVVARDEDSTVDWARSFHGLSSTPFTPEQAAVLQQETPPDDIEIKPDGIIYLPEIKYRRILNKAFGPGGWGLAPRGETIVTPKTVTREYGLVCGGRLVSVSRGEQQYFDPEGIPTATEGCKSNALMRCCKDLGVASELWDPRFIRKFMAEYAKSPIVEHAVTKKRRKMWMRKDDPVQYPFTEVPTAASAPVRTTPPSKNTAPAAKKS